METAYVQDPRLSWQAKGVLTYLLALPPQTAVSIEGLVKVSADGVTAVRSALRELAHYDYVLLVYHRNGTGTHAAGKRWQVAPHLLTWSPPDLQESCSSGNHQSKPDLQESCSSGNHQTGLYGIDTGDPSHETGTPLLEDLEPFLDPSSSLDPQDPLSLSPKSSLSSPRKPPQTVQQKGYAPGFCTFYAAYPKKEGPDEAYKVWQQRKLEPVVAEILTGLERNLTENPQWKTYQYIPQPARFLRGGQWHNQFPDGSPSAPIDPVKVAAFDALLARLAEEAS